MGTEVDSTLLPLGLISSTGMYILWLTVIYYLYGGFHLLVGTEVERNLLPVGWFSSTGRY